MIWTLSYLHVKDRQRLPLTLIRVPKLLVFNALQITVAACNHGIHRQEVVPLSQLQSLILKLRVLCSQDNGRGSHDSFCLN